MDDFFHLLAKGRSKVPVARFVPKLVRAQLSRALVEPIDDVIGANSIGAWERLLGFASLTLRLPPAVERGWSDLHQTILKNIKGYDEGTTLQHLLSLCPDGSANGLSAIKPRVQGVSQKLEEGDVRAAVQHLSSDETLSGFREQTSNLSREKHPPERRDCKLPAGLSGLTELDRIWVTTSQVKVALRSFPPATSGGIDCPRPRHLLDALGIGRGTDTQLHRAMARFCERIINDQILSFMLKKYTERLLRRFVTLMVGPGPLLVA